ncbi:DNA-binding protein [Geobacter sp. AOG1]|uniref:DNA-binding protein n=1 Tax=Geobacter sp. AOG1 TaxID=1566346 RepID=UPI001CC3B882|nr:DNA-binding protein [Geobacter sp. AOG1]GFE56740.1 hypothetical protein AOG1_06190 [Geobacter sp. AOG1]
MLDEKATVITKEHVYTAADNLLSKGQRPSVTKVRDELKKMLGVKGSPNKINALLQEWWAERARQQTPAEQAPTEPLPEDLEQVLKNAGSSFNGFLRELTDSLGRTVSGIRHNVARDHATRLEASIAAEREKAEMAADGEAEALQEIEQLEAENEEKAARISELEAALATLNTELVVARAMCGKLARENREQFDKLLAAINSTTKMPPARKKRQPSCAA